MTEEVVVEDQEVIAEDQEVKVEDQEVTTPEPTKPLTVGDIVESLKTFPQESEIYAGIEGVGLTISIVGAVVLNSVEGKQLTIMQLHGQGVLRALQHHQTMLQQNGEVAN